MLRKSRLLFRKASLSLGLKKKNEKSLTDSYHKAIAFFRDVTLSNPYLKSYFLSRTYAAHKKDGV